MVVWGERGSAPGGATTLEATTNLKCLIAVGTGTDIYMMISQGLAGADKIKENFRVIKKAIKRRH